LDDSWATWLTAGERVALLITSLRFSSERVCAVVNRTLDIRLVEMPFPLSYYDGTILVGVLQPHAEGVHMRHKKVPAIRPQDPVGSPHKARHRHSNDPAPELPPPLVLELEDLQAWRGAIVGEHSKHDRARMVQEIVSQWCVHQVATLGQDAPPLALFNKPWVPVKDLGRFVQVAQLGYLDGKETACEAFWAACPVRPRGLLFHSGATRLSLAGQLFHVERTPTRSWLPSVHLNENRVDLYIRTDLERSKKARTTGPSELMFLHDQWWQRVGSQDLAASLKPWDGAEPMPPIDLPSPKDLHHRVSDWAWDGTIWRLVRVDWTGGWSQAGVQDQLPIGEFWQSLKFDPGEVLPLHDYRELQGLRVTPEATKTTEDTALQSPGAYARNTLKRLLPNYMHLNLQQPIFPTLTKYERAQLLSLEAERLSRGGDATLEVGTSSSVLEIAERELLHGVLPNWLRRPLPNGEMQELPAYELDVQWNVHNNKGD
jgi:DNA-directed RNA polymerase subunit K/omega